MNFKLFFMVNIFDKWVSLVSDRNHTNTDLWTKDEYSVKMWEKSTIAGLTRPSPRPPYPEWIGLGSGGEESRPLQSNGESFDLRVLVPSLGDRRTPVGVRGDVHHLSLEERKSSRRDGRG